MPLGPNNRVRAILLVKGGEMRGRIVIALKANLSHVGKFKRVVTKAKIKPSAVPATPTEQPRRILLMADCLSYQLSRKGRRFAKVKLPSTQKVMTNKRQSG